MAAEQRWSDELVIRAAVALYGASGYTDITGFGYYADSPKSVSLGKRLPPGPRSRVYSVKIGFDP